MPYKLTGTLIALLFYGCLLNITVFLLSPHPASAQLSELSEIQNGIFFLSHKNMGITSETFKTDKYIDDVQAEYFSEISRPEINTPADGNYPFTLVDHYILDSDLEIQYNYNNILGPYPSTAYLSLHNISIADYTDKKSPPAFFLTEIRGKEPFHNDKVKAVSWILNKYEYEQNEYIYTHNYKYSEGSYNGYMINAFLRVSGKFAVWAGDTHQYLLISPTPADSCLPLCDIDKPNTIRIIRTPYDTSHPGNFPAMPILSSPRSSCYYPLPKERHSAAATNWSYNYNLRNAASSSK